MASKKATTIKEAPPDAQPKATGNLLDTWDPRKTKEILKDVHPHPVTGRLIDNYHPKERTKPMRVLCLGMSRTGTMSLMTALQKLGYTPYHMVVAMGSPKNNLNLWGEGVKAKHGGEGKKWGHEELDKMLGEYDALLDVPCLSFVEELVAAYPDAKVVLSSRDLEPWLMSLDSTGGHVLRWNWSMVAAWDPSLAGPFWNFAQIVCPSVFGTLNDFSSPQTPARKAFNDHYALVRRVVPKERLLEYRVQEGWGPLCEFLDVEAPNEDFPRVNDAKQFVFAHSLMWWLAFGKMVTKVGVILAVPTTGIVAAWWWTRK